MKYWWNHNEYKSVSLAISVNEHSLEWDGSSITESDALSDGLGAPY